jgi:hypothetical protein
LLSPPSCGGLRPGSTPSSSPALGAHAVDRENNTPHQCLGRPDLCHSDQRPSIILAKHFTVCLEILGKDLQLLD